MAIRLYNTYLLQIGRRTAWHTYGCLDEYTDIRTDPNCIVIESFVTKLFFFSNIRTWLSDRLSIKLSDIRSRPDIRYPVSALTVLIRFGHLKSVNVDSFDNKSYIMNTTFATLTAPLYILFFCQIIWCLELRFYKCCHSCFNSVFFYIENLVLMMFIVLQNFLENNFLSLKSKIIMFIRSAASFQLFLINAIFITK